MFHQPFCACDNPNAVPLVWLASFVNHSAETKPLFLEFIKMANVPMVIIVCNFFLLVVQCERQSQRLWSTDSLPKCLNARSCPVARVRSFEQQRRPEASVAETQSLEPPPHTVSQVTRYQEAGGCQKGTLWFRMKAFYMLSWSLVSCCFLY